MDTKTCPNCGGDGFEDIETAFGGILTCPDCSGEGKIKASLVTSILGFYQDNSI